MPSPVPPESQIDTFVHSALDIPTGALIEDSPFNDSISALSLGEGTSVSNGASTLGTSFTAAAPCASLTSVGFSTSPPTTALYNPATLPSANPNLLSQASRTSPLDPSQLWAHEPATAPSFMTGGASEPYFGPCSQNTILYINTFRSDSSTACSIAFSLVFQHNRRGYSTSEIELRLRPGYQKDNSLAEGCRVDNNVLLQLLAEIS